MNLFKRLRDQDQDLAEELASHIAIEKAAQQAEGKSPDEAEHSARKLFGNTTTIQEGIREQWSVAVLERFVQDCRFGIRLLLRSPLGSPSSAPSSRLRLESAPLSSAWFTPFCFSRCPIPSPTGSSA